jgi:hypothetical protein
MSVVVLLGGLALPKNRDWDRAAKLFANGIALGPLMMILLSPLPQEIGWHIDLLEIVVNEARITIFLAAGWASLQLSREIV